MSGQNDGTMTTHVTDGRATHQATTIFAYRGMDLWVESTECGLWYVRQDHPLESRVPIEIPRYHETANPVDCMTCLVRIAEP